MVSLLASQVTESEPKQLVMGKGEMAETVRLPQDDPPDKGRPFNSPQD